MKPSKIFIFPVIFLLLVVSVFSQTPPDPGRPDYEGIIRAKRAKLIKYDIFREIKLLSKKDQSYYYLRLADTLWRRDQKEEATALFQKGVEIGIDPTNQYKNDAEKLSHFWSLLNNVLEEQPVLADKIISKIREIKIDESNPEVLESSNKTYIVIAQQILSRKKDVQSAFDFAMLSLRGKNPAINFDTSRFYWGLKFSDENLASLYFAKAIESVKTNKDKVLLREFINYFVERYNSGFQTKDKRFFISDSQKKDFLELLLSFIEKDVENLTLKKIDYCGSIITGQRFSEDYRRLLPEKTFLVEKAVAVCQNAEIKSWKKPDFLKRPRQTVADNLNLAKEIDDRKIQIRYLTFAAQKARDEKDYRLSIDILDGIEYDLRDSFWRYSKIISVSKLIQESFEKEDFAAITNLLEIQQQEFRPFIIINALRYGRSIEYLKLKQKEFALNLIKQARTDLNKIDKSTISPTEFLTNPTNFGQITNFYVVLKSYNEAITSHTESIKSLNKYVSNLPLNYRERNFIPRQSSYSNFINSNPSRDSDFINQYFDRIYANIGSIENNKIRLSERIEFLEKNMEKPQKEVLIPGIPNDVK